MKVIYTRLTNIYFFYILNQKVETDQSTLNDIVLPKPRDFKNPIRRWSKIGWIQFYTWVLLIIPYFKKTSLTVCYFYLLFLLPRCIALLGTLKLVWPERTLFLENIQCHEQEGANSFQ